MENHTLRKEAWLAKAEQLHKVKEIIKKYEGLNKQLTNELIEMSKGVSSYAGEFKFTLIQTRGTIDYKSIPELQSLDLEPYRKPGSHQWKLFQFATVDATERHELLELLKD